jgi:hypothetical protein
LRCASHPPRRAPSFRPPCLPRADNNIGRSCYRISQIQRTFRLALESIERLHAALDAPPPAGAADGGADAPSVGELRERGLQLVHAIIAELEHPPPPMAH